MLNLRRCYSHGTPIACMRSVADKSPRHLIGAENRPPQKPVGERGYQLGDAFRHHRSLRRLSYQDRCYQLQKVLVGERRWARKVERPSQLWYFYKVCEDLSHIDNLLDVFFRGESQGD